MTPDANATTVASTTEEIVVRRPLFDLEKFTKSAVESKVKFAPAASMKEFLERIENDEVKALKVANAGLRRMAIQEAKQSMGSDNLVSPKIVSGFVNNFRPMFPLKDDSKEARATQTKQVHDYIRGIPALLTAIKAIAAASVDIDDEDETGDDATE